MVDDPIYGSKGQQIGYRRGSEVFNLEGKKHFNVDTSGKLIDPKTGSTAGYLQPPGAVAPDRSLDRLFEN